MKTLLLDLGSGYGNPRMIILGKELSLAEICLGSD